MSSDHSSSSSLEFDTKAWTKEDIKQRLEETADLRVLSVTHHKACICLLKEASALAILPVDKAKPAKVEAHLHNTQELLSKFQAALELRLEALMYLTPKQLSKYVEAQSSLKGVLAQPKQYLNYRGFPRYLHNPSFTLHIWQVGSSACSIHNEPVALYLQFMVNHLSSVAGNLEALWEEVKDTEYVPVTLVEEEHQCPCYSEVRSPIY